MAEQADVIVVGLGVGGEALAGDLAEAGLDVVGIENRLVGGECPYWACVPTKMMVRATDALAEARRVGELAGSATVSPDWAPVARRISDEATDDWDDRVAVERFESKGGRFVRGAARITGPRTVEVDGNPITASRGLVVATGTAQPPDQRIDPRSCCSPEQVDFSLRAAAKRERFCRGTVRRWTMFPRPQPWLLAPTNP